MVKHTQTIRRQFAWFWKNQFYAKKYFIKMPQKNKFGAIHGKLLLGIVQMRKS